MSRKYITIEAELEIPDNWNKVGGATWELPDGRQVGIWLTAEVYDKETNEYQDVSLESVGAGLVEYEHRETLDILEDLSDA